MQFLLWQDLFPLTCLKVSEAIFSVLFHATGVVGAKDISCLRATKEGSLLLGRLTLISQLESLVDGDKSKFNK